MIDRTLQWLGERTSLPRIMRDRMLRPAVEGRWRSVTAALILLLIVLQFVTGFIIIFYYVPSTPHAHTSVLYLIKEVPGGALLRSLHHYSASALILLLIVYLAQLFYTAAYRHKRELLWISSVLLLGLVLAACFTGQLLPWDQKGYYGTRVAASIQSDLPLIGDSLRRLFLGDTDISTLTLSRFFALHTLAIPALFIIVLGLRATFSGDHDAALAPGGESYYPNQFAREAFACAALFVAILAFSASFQSPLEPVADPSDTGYIARPEWYFLPLFQLLKVFPASLEGLLATLTVTLVGVAVAAVPFLDRTPERTLKARRVPAALLVTIAVGAVALAMGALMEDRRPEISSQLARQRDQAREMINAPFRPIPIGRATPAPVVESSVTSVADQPPVVKTFIGLCAPCHGPQATGGALGPSLIGLAEKGKYTQEELIQVVAQPTSHGLTDAMPGFNQLSKEQRVELAEWLFTLNSPQQLAGAPPQPKTPPQAFITNCAGCHGEQAEGGFGPALAGVGKRRSRDELIKLIEDPTSVGLKNIMPPFKDMPAAERAVIADWLMTLK